MLQYIKKYFWVGRLLTVIACSFFSARIATAAVSKWLAAAAPVPAKLSAPKPPSVPEEEAEASTGTSGYDVIVSRNVFDAANAPAEAGSAEAGQEAAGGPESEGPAVKTTLEMKVLGIMAIGEGKDRRSSAVIESSRAKKKVDVYRVGQTIDFANNGRLVKVAKDRIEFMNGNRLEYAEIEGLQGKSTVMIGPNKPTDNAEKKPEAAAQEDKAEGVAKLSEGKYVIDQREIDAALQNLDQLYTEIRAVPNFKDGKVAGLKLLSIRPDSLFAKLGLKRGDVLERINGMDLDIKRGLEIFNQLKDQKTLTIDVTRRGSPLTMDYEIR